jgi:hypothetical protein
VQFLELILVQPGPDQFLWEARCQRAKAGADGANKDSRNHAIADHEFPFVFPSITVAFAPH